MTYHGVDTLIFDTKQCRDWVEPDPARPRLMGEVLSRLRLRHDSLRRELVYLYRIRWYIHSTLSVILGK